MLPQEATPEFCWTQVQLPCILFCCFEGLDPGKDAGFLLVLEVVTIA